MGYAILELYGIALHFIVTFGIFCYLINGIWYILLPYKWYCMVLYCIVLLASARGLCLARRLYTSLCKNQLTGIRNSCTSQKYEIDCSKMLNTSRAAFSIFHSVTNARCA